VNTSLFVADRGNSYRCHTKTTITGFNTTRNLTITSIEFENLRIQSFVDDSKEFNNYGVGMYFEKQDSFLIFYIRIFLRKSLSS
jgi:hypothetical protein